LSWIKPCLLQRCLQPKISLPCSIGPYLFQAFQELCLVQQGMLASPLSTLPDHWKYEWGEKYLPAQYYKHLHAHLPKPVANKWLWKSACVLTAKVFAWLLVNDRLNTQDLLVRRHWNVSECKNCVLCPTQPFEDRLHLFFNCNFSARI
jgi:hypothetical protein